MFIVAKLALVLPYSNESEESLLRTVCTTKTTFPASMGSKTLSSILTVKYANPNAAKFKPGKKVQLGNKIKDTHDQYHQHHLLLLLKI